LPATLHRYSTGPGDVSLTAAAKTNNKGERSARRKPDIAMSTKRLQPTKYGLFQCGESSSLEWTISAFSVIEAVPRRDAAYRLRTEVIQT